MSQNVPEGGIAQRRKAVQLAVSSENPAGKAIEIFVGKIARRHSVNVQVRVDLARSLLDLILLIFRQFDRQFASGHGLASCFPIGRFESTRFGHFAI